MTGVVGDKLTGVTLKGLLISLNDRVEWAGGRVLIEKLTGGMKEGFDRGSDRGRERRY